MDITKHDKNLIVPTKIEREGLVYFNVEEDPRFSVYGVKHDDGKYRRMPETVAKAVSTGVHGLHALTAGGRVRFVTDSPYIAIYAKMGNVGKLSHFALTGSAGFDLYAEERYVNTFVPPYNVADAWESVVDLRDDMWDGAHMYTIHMPLFSEVVELYVGVREGSLLQSAPQYRYSVPVVYYGSSITNGACASRPGNAYENILSRLLDCDHINLGFSGSALAEDAMADYITGLEMSAFVYDYDHNAPSPEYLKNTHSAMFHRIREARPDLKILMLSRPQYHLDGNERAMLQIIQNTYEDAIAAGDENVWFIPGPKLLNEQVWDTALVDNCHPNDSGFASMAYAIRDVLKQMLEK